MSFKILYEDKTPKGANFWKMMVEIAHGIWVDAVYFGNTKPKAITKLRLYKDGWIAEIQKHVSRDRDSGKFKCARKEA